MHHEFTLLGASALTLLLGMGKQEPRNGVKVVVCSAPFDYRDQEADWHYGVRKTKCCSHLN